MCFTTWVFISDHRHIMVRGYQPCTSKRKPENHRLGSRFHLHGRMLLADTPKKLQKKGDEYSEEAERSEKKLSFFSSFSDACSCVLMHCIWQIPVYVLMSVANKYPCLLSFFSEQQTTQLEPTPQAATFPESTTMLWFPASPRLDDLAAIASLPYPLSCPPPPSPPPLP